MKEKWDLNEALARQAAAEVGIPDELIAEVPEILVAICNAIYAERLACHNIAWGWADWGAGVESVMAEIAERGLSPGEAA